MWGHMAFVSTILISHDAMWMVTKAFEGHYFFGRSFPEVVSVIVAIVFVLCMANPGASGPCASGDGVWSGMWWPLYLVLLFCVELHGGVGLYRLVVKWGWFEGAAPNRPRRPRAPLEGGPPA